MARSDLDLDCGIKAVCPYRVLHVLHVRLQRHGAHGIGGIHQYRTEVEVALDRGVEVDWIDGEPGIDVVWKSVTQAARDESAAKFLKLRTSLCASSALAR